MRCPSLLLPIALLPGFVPAAFCRAAEPAIEQVAAEALPESVVKLAAELRKLDTSVFLADAAPKPAEAMSIAQREALRESNRNSTAAWRAIDSREAWEKFRAQKLAALRGSLHLPPPQPAPVVITTRDFTGDGFIVENVLIATRPGLYITANMYRPARENPEGKNPRMPGIVLSHSHHSPKTQGELQDMGMTWARQGCVVLVPDHFGHGERREHGLNTAADFPQPFAVGRQDYYFRYDNSLLLYVAGESLMGWLVHDLMRCVDALIARPDVDAKKLVLLGGVAGGGDPAAVTAALDERISVAAPFNFGGPQPETRYPLPDDAEETFNYAGGGSWEATRNLHRSAADGFLPWVIVGGIAPRGLIYGHEFSWDRERDPVWKRLEKIWAFYEAGDKLGFAHGRGTLKGQPPESTHCGNIGPPHRINIHAALAKWLGVETSPTKEYSQRLPSEQLLCWTPELREQLKPKTLVEVLSAKIEAQRKQMQFAFASENAAERKLFPTAIKLQWNEALPSPKFQKSEFNSDNVDRPREMVGNLIVTRFADGADPQLPAAVVMLRPKADPLRAVVVGVCQAGKQRFLQERAIDIALLLDARIAVCLIDVPGVGENAASADRGRTSAASSHSASALMLAKPLLSMRLQEFENHAAVHSFIDSRVLPLGLWGESFAPVNGADVNLVVPHNIEERPQQAEPLGGLLALLTGLSNAKVQAVYVRGGLTEYRSMLQRPLVYLPHDAVPPGVLNTGDLPLLAAAIAPRSLRLVELVDAGNRRASQAELDRCYAPTTAAYIAAGQPAKLSLSAKAEKPGDVAAWFIEQFEKK